jgi:hypothetical protein
MQTRPPFWRLHSTLAVWILVGMASGQALAQCATQWLSGDGTPGTASLVYATTTWDPDGPGPLSPVVVVGGTFPVAGTVMANNIAAFDPVAGIWSALGTGVNNPVSSLTTLPNGDLVAGGSFTMAGGGAASRIARWNARAGRRWARASPTPTPLSTP